MLVVFNCRVVVSKSLLLVFAALVSTTRGAQRLGRCELYASEKELAKMLSGIKCRVNLIRFHPIPDTPLESPSEEACEFNWYLMRGGSTEENISIITAWILRAEQRLIPYSLEMPSDALPAGLGDEHRDACLEILALFNRS